LIDKIFAAGKRGRRWITLVTSEIAGEIGEDAPRVRRAIRDLEDAGDVLVQPSGLRQQYRLLDEDIDIGQLTQQFRDFFTQRERQDIQRLNGVVDYAGDKDCRVGVMLDYFGESMRGQCGQCDVCRGTNAAGGLPEGFQEEITSEEIHAVHNLVAERHTALGSPRQLTRFLCGLRSPAAGRARLTRHDQFGLLERLPFRDVLAFTESLNLG